MTCQKAVPRPHFHANGSNAARPKCWKLVCRSSSSRTNILRYLRAPRAVSSVGSEHLVYTEGVGGSSPSPPTQNKAQKPLRCRGFCCHAPSLLVGKHALARSLLVGGKGQSFHSGPPLNASRSITKDITHHKQTAAHPNHVFFRTMREGAIQCFQWRAQDFPSQFRSDACHEVWRHGPWNVGCTPPIRRRLRKQSHDSRRVFVRHSSPNNVERAAPLPCIPLKFFDRLGDAIEVVGAIEHHEGTTGKLNALPTAKLTGQRSVVRQPV